MQVIEGHSIRILCQADGFPPPVMSWKKALGEWKKI